MTRKMNRAAFRRLAAMVAGVMVVTQFVGMAQANPTGEAVINISGATLFKDFFKTASFTNDYIDVDGDGFKTGSNPTPPPYYVDDLTRTVSMGGSLLTRDNGGGTPATDPGQWWVVQYRGVGSGNGLAELVTWWNGNKPAKAAADLSSSSDASINNATMSGTTGLPGQVWYYSNQTSASDVADVNNVGTANGNIGGARVDIATSDVGSKWFIKKSGTDATKPVWGQAPTANGYGSNAVKSDTNQGNTLKSLSVATAVSGSTTPGMYTATDGVKRWYAGGTAFDGVGNTTDTAVDGSTLNINTASPTSTTIYDTEVAYVAVGFIVNKGVGTDIFSDRDTDGSKGDIKKSELQHLFVTGRASNGEDLMVVTRDSGSGTRNAAMNSIGIDPSYGVGDNKGAKNSSSTNTGDAKNVNNVLGSSFMIDNKGESGDLSTTVQNARLAIGYNGLVGHVDKNVRADMYEALAVQNDLQADGGKIANADSTGYKYVRAKQLGVDISAFSGWTKITYAATGGTNGASILFNDANNDGLYTSGESKVDASTINNLIYNKDAKTGYQVGGNQTMMTVGDPFAAYDLNGDGNTTGTNEAAWDGHAGNPTMQNAQAAMLIRNIVKSIQDYSSSPNSPDVNGTPGEYLAEAFQLVAAVEALHSASNPELYTDNSQFNANLYPRKSTTNDIGIYGQESGTGLVSTRLNNATYARTYSDKTDAYTAGSSKFYITNGNTQLAYAATMTLRNEIAGDFNNDGKRNATVLKDGVTDIQAMMHSYLCRGDATQADASTTSVKSQRAKLALGETVGSLTFAADASASLELLGDFNADGNFSDADVEYAANGLFVAGRTGDKLNRKANFKDIDQAWKDMTGNFFWADASATTVVTKSTAGAYRLGDARGDVNGDNVINAADVTAIYATINAGKNAQLNDGNSAADWSNLNEAYAMTYTTGAFGLNADINGDMVVDINDVIELVGGYSDPGNVRIADSILGAQFGDFNLDGTVNIIDRDILLDNLLTGSNFLQGDANFDGVVNIQDRDMFLATLNLSTHTPEPTSLALLAVGGALLARRQRKA